MARAASWIIAAGAAAIMIATAGLAQAPEPVEVEAAPLPPVPKAAPETPDLNPDEMADYLNSQQQIRQTVTVTRTINGEVVETDKRTIVYTSKDPVRTTEAAVSPIDALRAAFDREALTRSEAFEEAKLDFVIADKNRDALVTIDEFVAFTSTLRARQERGATLTDEEAARERQYRAFIDALDPDAARLEAEARARAKFSFMAGASPGLSRRDFLREQLLDFDSMDVDGDMILRGDELMRFRALNRGERLDG